MDFHYTWCISSSNNSGVFYLKDFTPGTPMGIAPLTDANVAQSIRNAKQYLQGAGKGGVIQVPPGTWRMGADGGLDLYGDGNYTGGIVLRGACNGASVLSYPRPWTGEMIRLRGTGAAPGPWRQGGIEDLILQVEEDGPDNTGDGIVLDAVTAANFKNIHTYNLQGGRPWVCRDFAGGNNNSQGCTFWNCGDHGGRVNWDLQALSASQFYNCASQAAQYRDFLIDGCIFSWIGGTLQTANIAAFIELSGAGGCDVSFDGLYHEGATGIETFFKLPAVEGSHNTLMVRNLILGGSPAFLVDIGDNQDVSLENIGRAPNANVIVRARGTGPFPAPQVRMVNSGSPIANPSKFDLDSYSLQKFSCLNGSELVLGAAVISGAQPWP